MRKLLAPIALIALWAGPTAAAPEPQEAPGAPPLSCVNQLWKDFDRLKGSAKTDGWDLLVRQAADCARALRPVATDIQADLKSEERVCKPWRITTDQQRIDVNARGQLNEMGAALFMQAFGQARLRDKPAALIAQNDLCNFQGACVWDPQPATPFPHGWFWNPSVGIVEELKKMNVDATSCRAPQ